MIKYLFHILPLHQMELATGEFPYSKWGSPFEQIKQVVMEVSPKLPADQFSPDFCDFIDKWWVVPPL